MLLRQEHQGTNHRHVGTGKVGHRREGVHPALIEKAHEERLDHVLPVVAQGHLVAAPIPGGVVEGASTELGAQGAGALLLTDVEDHVSDIGLDERVVHADALREGDDGRPVLLHDAQVQADGAHLELRPGEALVQLQSLHQQQGVLPPRDTDAHLVAIFQQMISLVRPPNAAQYPFHSVCPSVIDP